MRAARSPWITLAALGCAGLLLARTASASEPGGPRTCEVGAYLISLHDFDFARGSFGADLWLWSTWYAEAGLDFGRLLPGWLLLLRYRYSRFSGDADPDDSTHRAFDPLFYGFNHNRGVLYGTWFQGEIVGEYLLFNASRASSTSTPSGAPCCTRSSTSS